MRERSAEMWGFPGLDALWRDVRLGIRSLLGAPVFSAAVVLSLALGVGGSAAVFSLAETVVLRPLPYPHAERLYDMRIWWGDFSSNLSVADHLATREISAGIGEAGGFYFPDDGFTVTGPNGPTVVAGAVLTPELPAILRVAPMVGRVFEPGRGTREALIGARFWRERYHASREALDSSLNVDGETYPIVGVMPAGFNVGPQPDGELWLRSDLRTPTRRGPFYIENVFRLAPGIGSSEAGQELTARVAPIMHDRYGITDRWHYGLVSLKDRLTGSVRPTLRLLTAAVALLLLIAVFNVSNLIASRALARRHELGLRAALGAGRTRLVQHLLIESAVLGTVGTAAGLGLAAIALLLLRTDLAGVMPRATGARIDTSVAAFGIVTGVGAALVTGVLPALRLPWSRLVDEIRAGSRRATSVRSATRAWLVVGEVAIALTLLSGAVLLVKSLVKLDDVDPGFDPTDVLSFRLTLPLASYPDTEPARLENFLGRVGQQLRRLPGVVSVAFSGALPPDQLPMANDYTLEGVEPGARGVSGVADWVVADTGYLATLRIRLLAGRNFTGADGGRAPNVALVNQTFARRHFSGREPIGHRLRGGAWSPTAPWVTIVGVVQDVPYANGVWGGPDETVYVPYAQNLWQTSPYVTVRVTHAADALLPAVRRAVAASDPEVPLRDIATMQHRLRRSVSEPRLRAQVLATLAAIALVLAITGIYGQLAYDVGRRRHEIATRRALGAPSGRVLAGVVGSGMRLAGFGAVLGVAGALLLRNSLSGLLFGVAPTDVLALVTATAVLLGTAFVACVVPASRAARVDPITILREE